MKGITKAIKRTPHLVTSKVGMSKKSTDPEFDDYQRKFATMEDTVEKLLKDCKKFNESVVNLFTAGSNYAQHFTQLFHPIVGEYDLIGKHPEAADTIRNVDGYQSVFEELRANISPELELIESRIVGPVKELQTIMKQIRKSITKRDHKLLDYDRFNNSLTKLRDKKEKSLNDEKNLFKLEQDFEIATNEYEYINNAMKQDLPRFMVLSTQFIDPLYQSFYYMQLNIYYMLMEKLTGFAEGKYEVHNLTGEQITEDYENKRTDAWERIEGMAITKRIVSTQKMLQSARQNSTSSYGSSGAGGLGRSNTIASSSTTSSGGLHAPPPVRSVSGSSFVKKMPPPPSSFGSQAPAAPPPYSPGSASSAAAIAAAAAKRAPPPPPPLKPKPKSVQYVVALYDFIPQAEGDLEFHVGDRIEVVERTASQEDWWTGKLNGKQGVFPGNYVQDA